MLRHLFTLLSLFTLFSFELEDDPPIDDDPDKGKKPDGITPEIEAFYKSIISRDTKKAKADGKRAADDAHARTKQQEDSERQRKLDEEKGNYEKAKTDLEKRMTDAETSLASVTAERDALSTYFSSQYDAALKELPETILAFKPADDASFEAKSAWLTTAREQAKKLTGETQQQPPKGKQPHKPTKPDADAEAARREQIAQARRRISI